MNFNILEEKLNEIETKELVYIFLSIPIVVFIIYYNFIYPSLEDTSKKLTKEYSKKSKQLSKIVSDIRKVKNSKNILAPTRQKLENLKDDFKYIKYKYSSIDLVRLDDRKIYVIFTKLLNKSNKLNLNTSFDIKWDIQPIKPFNSSVEVTITGDGDYKDIIKYLQFIDHLKSLIIVNNIKIALSLDEKVDVLDSLVKEKKANSNSISFVLTKYSENTLKYLKNLAKTKQLDIFISVDKDNVNYLDISFKGEYGAVKSILDLLKNINKQNNKPFEFTKLRANLKVVNFKKESKNTQQFTITLQMVGEK